MRILVVNAGSSSVKLRVVDDHDVVLASRDLGALNDLEPTALVDAISGLGPFDAVGHRIVHGGLHYTAPVVVDDRVVRDLRDLVDLAPLHQPGGSRRARRGGARRPRRSGGRVLRHRVPRDAAGGGLDLCDSRRVATARSAPLRLPRARARVREPEGRGAVVATGRALRVVTCHLGSGASVAAVAAGISVDTSMGFTPLEGLVMATRSGSIDPGAILWLQTHEGLSAELVGDRLEHQSGLVGLAGTSDMRAVLAAAEAGDDAAGRAIDVYVHRLRREIGAMAAAMDGLDALVFSGGVGERADAPRACRRGPRPSRPRDRSVGERGRRLRS